MGPSPLARGSHGFGDMLSNQSGSIPARAGQPLTSKPLSPDGLLRNSADELRGNPKLGQHDAFESDSLAWRASQAADG